MLNNAILITGAGKRLGFALAQALHSCDTPVVISYRTDHPQIQQLRELGVHCIQADFADDDGIQAFSQKVSEQYQSLKAIIHNASDWVAETAEIAASEVMAKMLQVHVQAPYQLNLALQPLLLNYQQRTNSAADIVHLTDYIVEKGSKKHIAYAASKAALANLTLSFSTLLAPKVKVNSIAPSLLMFNDDDDDNYQQKALKKSLMQIAPGAFEGVQAVQYLLNSRYITGTTIHLDGGRHLA
ncbi:dihydromonapterin reductase [Thalassotalea sp. ND16A]|uniref:dihydromonapterin reductase n=1 Tax=Thalassotalea sp. ND16A TaxID=1535422 RepID=UPI00051A823B|nr:dihydromonapterin reductase [Thalassotalea sp. ND16A]KGK00578.1 Dihydrofolate reductase [Thalassotalea sp. ND16A]